MNQGRWVLSALLSLLLTQAQAAELRWRVDLPAQADIAGNPGPLLPRADGGVYAVVNQTRQVGLATLGPEGRVLSQLSASPERGWTPVITGFVAYDAELDGQGLPRIATSFVQIDGGSSSVLRSNGSALIPESAAAASVIRLAANGRGDLRWSQGADGRRELIRLDSDGQVRWTSALMVESIDTSLLLADGAALLQWVDRTRPSLESRRLVLIGGDGLPRWTLTLDDGRFDLRQSELLADGSVLLFGRVVRASTSEREDELVYRLDLRSGAPRWRFSRAATPGLARVLALNTDGETATLLAAIDGRSEIAALGRIDAGGRWRDSATLGEGGLAPSQLLRDGSGQLYAFGQRIAPGGQSAGSAQLWQLDRNARPLWSRSFAAGELAGLPTLTSTAGGPLWLYARGASSTDQRARLWRLDPRTGADLGAQDFGRWAHDASIHASTIWQGQLVYALGDAAGLLPAQLHTMNSQGTAQAWAAGTLPEATEVHRLSTAGSDLLAVGSGRGQAQLQRWAGDRSLRWRFAARHDRNLAPDGPGLAALADGGALALHVQTGAERGSVELVWRRLGADGGVGREQSLRRSAVQGVPELAITSSGRAGWIERDGVDWRLGLTDGQGALLSTRTLNGRSIRDAKLVLEADGAASLAWIDCAGTPLACRLYSERNSAAGNVWRRDIPLPVVASRVELGLAGDRLFLLSSGTEGAELTAYEWSSGRLLQRLRIDSSFDIETLNVLANGDVALAGSTALGGLESALLVRRLDGELRVRDELFQVLEAGRPARATAVLDFAEGLAILGTRRPLGQPQVGVVAAWR